MPCLRRKNRGGTRGCVRNALSPEARTGRPRVYRLPRRMLAVVARKPFPRRDIQARAKPWFRWGPDPGPNGFRPVGGDSGGVTVNRCTLGDHVPCNACGFFVSSVEPHVHAIGRSQRRILCGDCYDAIIIAARHTLLAVKSGGFRYNNAEQLRRLLDTGAIVTFAQEPLPHLSRPVVGQGPPEST